LAALGPRPRGVGGDDPGARGDPRLEDARKIRVPEEQPPKRAEAVAPPEIVADAAMEAEGLDVEVDDLTVEVQLRRFPGHAQARHQPVDGGSLPGAERR